MKSKWQTISMRQSERTVISLFVFRVNGMRQFQPEENEYGLSDHEETASWGKELGRWLKKKYIFGFQNIQICTVYCHVDWSCTASNTQCRYKIVLMSRKNLKIRSSKVHAILWPLNYSTAHSWHKYSVATMDQVPLERGLIWPIVREHSKNKNGFTPTP